MRLIYYSPINPLQGGVLTDNLVGPDAVRDNWFWNEIKKKWKLQPSTSSELGQSILDKCVSLYLPLVRCFIFFLWAAEKSKNTISASSERQLFSTHEEEEQGPEGIKRVLICKSFSPGKWDFGIWLQITQKHGRMTGIWETRRLGNVI